MRSDPASEATEQKRALINHKHLLEYQNCLFIRDFLCSKSQTLFKCCLFFQCHIEIDTYGSLRQLFPVLVYNVHSSIITDLLTL
jgi:hypothetical protein